MPQDRVPSMFGALKTHTTLQRIAKAVIPPGCDVFQQELRVAAEFEALLPPKITNLHRGVDMD